jgi:WD40 repeat protein
MPLHPRGRAPRFGQRFTAGAPASPAASALAPATPPLAIAPDGVSFAARLDARHVGFFTVGTLREDSAFAVAPGSSITALAWSPTNQQLAVGGERGMVSLWQVRGVPRLLRDFATLRMPTDAPEAVQSLSFSANGRLLAASDAIQPPGSAPRGRVIVWRLPDARVLSGPVDFAAPANAVAFSRDARLLGLALQDGRVIITDPESGRPRRTLHPFEGANGGTTSLGFGASGTLVVGDYAGILQEWNPVTGVPISRPVLAAPAPVASVNFDRSGTRIATTGGPGGGLKLWFASTLQQDGATLDPESGTWGNAGFTPDGATLISVSANGLGSAWPVNPASWAAHACAVAGRNLTREEWSRFVSGYPYSQVCP